jgi:hypothetical protein
MSTRFTTGAMFAILGGFVVVVSQAFSLSVAGRVAFGVGLSNHDATPSRRVRAKRLQRDRPAFFFTRSPIAAHRSRVVVANLPVDHAGLAGAHA